VFHQAHSDVDLAHHRDLRREDRLDWIRPVVVPPWRRFADLRAETEHYAILVGIHAIETGCQPDQDSREDNQDDALATKVPARQHRAKPVLAAPQEFFEIGRGGAAGWRLAGAPWALAAGPPWAAALIAPRHGISPRSPAQPDHLCG